MNRNRIKLALYAFTVICLAGGITGCSSSNGSTKGGDQANPPEAPKKQEPVTLRLFNLAGTTKENFDTKIKGPIEKKYPHITMEFVLNQKGTTLPELAATNTLPDIIFGKLSDRDKMMIDLSPLIKKHGFDTSRVKPVLWQAFQYMTDTDQKTTFIPFVTNMHLLQYNKDLFDKFGVGYPKNGMTWDETFEMAKRLARTENGVKYLAFNVRMNLNFTQTQLLLPFYDDKTTKPAFSTDAWNKYYANFARFFTIPGNEATKAGNELANDNLFLKDRRVAMYAAHGLFSTYSQMASEKNPMNWDMVSLPTFSGAPKQGTSPNANGLGITVTSKHQDDAFLAIQALLSDDIQLANARTGYESILANDAKQQAEFGKDMPDMAGKNISALFYNHYAPTPKPNLYNYRLSREVPYAHFQSVVWGQADINTALRNADEQANKIISEVNSTK